MWSEFGFKANPFDTLPIHGDDAGQRLLVGREREIKILANRLQNLKTVCCIEGPNGVGKTSLALVTAYTLSQRTVKQGKDSLIYISEPFQIMENETASDFKRKVYSKIAMHFIENQRELKSQLDIQFNLSQLEHWLADPVTNGGNVSVAGFGAGFNRSANLSPGFDEFGFNTIVERLLDRSFSDKGGVICIIDNLELLNTSKRARRLLEELRDELFTKKGMRWVVCGARGIIHSASSSARLQGYLQDPIDLKPLGQDSIQDLIESRVAEFGDKTLQNNPVNVETFKSLYGVVRNNLRDSMRLSTDYCSWLFENDYTDLENNDFYVLFEAWLACKSEEYAKACEMTSKAKGLFETMCSTDGAIVPTEFEQMGYKSVGMLRKFVSELEQLGLVMPEFDETDSNRDRIVVTAKGWFVWYHSSDYLSVSEPA